FGLAALPFVAAPGLSPLDLLGLPALAGVAIGAWLILRVAARHDWPAVARAGLIAAPLLYWPSLGFELPELTPLWISPRVEAALAAHWPDGKPADAASGAARFLAAGPDRVAAVGDRDVAQFHAEADKLGIAPHAFAEIAGFNYSRG